MILLDTHAFIWLLWGSDRLGDGARQRIAEARDAQGVLVSAITPWEIAMLANKGRLQLAMDVASWLTIGFELTGVRLAPLEPEIAILAGELPPPIHGDPADRIIIATARVLVCPVLTSDRRILDYTRAGAFEAVDAAR